MHNRGQMNKDFGPPFSRSFNNSNTGVFKPPLLPISQVTNSSLPLPFNHNLSTQQAQVPLHELIHQPNFSARFSSPLFSNKPERVNFLCSNPSASSLAWSSLQAPSLQSNVRSRFVRPPLHSGPLIRPVIPHSTPKLTPPHHLQNSQPHIRHQSSSVQQKPLMSQPMLCSPIRAMRPQVSPFLQNQSISSIGQNFLPMKLSLNFNKTNSKKDSQKQPKPIPKQPSLSVTENSKFAQDSSTASGNTKQTAVGEAKKISLIKINASKKFSHKKEKKRNVTSVKQVNVVDTSESTVTQKSENHEKMDIDLNIDEEYKRKLEEQKRLREEIIRQKEEKRRKMVAEKIKKEEEKSEESRTNKTSNQQQISCLLNPKRKSIKLINKKGSTENRSVTIKGLASTTSKATIIKLCTSVGPIENCRLDNNEAEERKAIVTFKNAEDAISFQKRYQRHLLDLCVIQVSLSW